MSVNIFKFKKLLKELQMIGNNLWVKKVTYTTNPPRVYKCELMFYLKENASRIVVEGIVKKYGGELFTTQRDDEIYISIPNLNIHIKTFKRYQNKLRKGEVIK